MEKPHALVVSFIGFLGSWAIVLRQSCLLNNDNKYKILACSKPALGAPFFAKVFV